MTKMVGVDEIDKVLSQMLAEYGDSVADAMTASIEKVAKGAKKVVKDNAPARPKGGDYKKAITVKDQTKVRGKLIKVIWAGKHYRLSHLLEYGHQTKSGSRTRAIPHFKKGEEYIQSNFVDVLTQEIEKIKE